MFSLLAGFFKWLFSKTEVQILIVGLDHAGKTTLLEQMKGHFQRTDHIAFDKIPPTVGLNIGRMDINNCRVLFWDLGGQARLRSLWDNYYAEAHGLLFVLDAADPDRFEEAKRAMYSLLIHPDLTGVPMLVCANKQDLPHARTAEEIGAYFEIHKDDADITVPNSNVEKNKDDNKNMPTSNLASVGRVKRQKKLQAISALTCAGVDEGVRWLIDSAVNNPDIIRARTPRP